MIIKYLTIAIIFITNIYTVLSQVTIGNTEKPANGALLQLKNKTGDPTTGSNANKGMMLPRVKLTSVNDLFPMFAKEDGTANDLYNDSSKKETQDKVHTGLLVYNTNIFCENDKMNLDGIYVWNANEWIHLGDEKQTNTDKVWLTKDQDGTSFKAALFGDKIWMVDNLSATKYASESGITITLPSEPNGVTGVYDNISLGYPGPNPAPTPLPSGATGATNGTDKYYYNNFKEYGILYTWIAATGNSSLVYNTSNYNPKDQQTSSLTTISNNEVEKTQPKGYIQGICPNGWHLPSDREWVLLTKEIFENPEKYSYISLEEQNKWIPNSWSDITYELPSSLEPIYIGLNTGENNLESNLALAMKRGCELAFVNKADIRPGKSFMPEQGGFNAIPSGSMYATGLVNYGTLAKYWSSSMTITPPTLNTNIRRAISRNISFLKNTSNSANSILKGASNTFDYCSVRCVYHGDYNNNMPLSWKSLFD